MTHPLNSADIRVASPEISNSCYVKKYGYVLHFDAHSLIYLTFFDSLRVVLNNIVAISMMSAKLALYLLKTKAFWNKDHEVLAVHDDTYKILSCDSNYFVDVVMWSKLGNSSIYTREVIITSILRGFDQKNLFIQGLLLIQNTYFGTGTIDGLFV